MLTTSCPTCAAPKNPNAHQCRTCANETVRQRLKGLPFTAERKANVKAALARKRAEGWKGFDIGATTRGKPSPKALPVGSTRVLSGKGKDGRVQVKCADGKWRYRSRAVWESIHGPLKSSTIIHHKNDDPADDRPENLEAVTRAQHAAIHADPAKMRAAQLLGVEVRKRNNSFRHPPERTGRSTSNRIPAIPGSRGVMSRLLF